MSPYTASGAHGGNLGGNGPQGANPRLDSDVASSLARRDFDWNLLHTFMVIVEAGSITRAADQLLRRQPSVSTALRRLEDQLGHRLIDRGPGRFQPTERGAILYRECQEICGAIGRLSGLIQDDRAEVTGHLRLHMASHVVFPPLDRALARFHAAHPGVTLEIAVATSRAIAQTVLAKQATAGICLMPERLPRLEYERLFRSYFGFYCGPGHRLFGRHDVHLADLASEGFVTFSTDTPNNALRAIALLRAQHDFNGPIVGTSTNLEEVRRMIIAGLGVGPLPVHVVERDAAEGLLWRLPPTEAPPSIDVFLITNPRASLSRAERLFLDTLRAEANQACGRAGDDAPSAPKHGEVGDIAIRESVYF